MLGIMVVAIASAALPQVSSTPTTKGEPITAKRVRVPPTLDGRLDEAGWATAPPTRRFYEVYPADRGSPSERTEARFLYDDRFLYVGVHAWLGDPSSLRAPFVRRDHVNHSQDYVQIYLDPQGSGRSSYLFRTNARGSKADASQSEATQTETNDPDFDWDVATHVDKDGWTAEFRIPLTTLRINRAGEQKWKAVVYRGVPRADNVQMSTAPIPRVASCFLCYSDDLSFADLTPGRDDVLVTPSAAGIVDRRVSPGNRPSSVDLKPSLDVKWLPYAGAAIDLTVKPNFIQVETDQPQLTSNARFAIDLPEKRPFFREGSDLIQSSIPILYTRTILAPDYGIRFTSRATMLNATVFAAKDAGRAGIVEPGFLSSTLGVEDVGSIVGYGRGRYTLGGADVGGVVAFKRNDDGSYNVVGGPDLTWGTSSDRVSAQLSVSDTRNPDKPNLLPTWIGQSLRGTAAVAQWDHTGSKLIWSARYSRFDDGYRAWLGYVPRVGYQEFLGKLKLSNTRTGTINELSPYLGYDRLSALKRGGVEHDLYPGLSVSAARDVQIDLSLHPDAVVLNAARQARTARFVEFTASANPFRWMPNVGLSGQVGRLVDFEVGDAVAGTTVTFDLELRPIDRFDLSGHFGLTRLGGSIQQPSRGADADDGLRLSETVSELSATWFFNSRLYVLADYQRYTSTRRLPVLPRDSSNLLNVQLSYDVNRDFQIFAGVRSGKDLTDLTAEQGRTIGGYLKISRTFHPRRRRLGASSGLDRSIE